MTRRNTTVNSAVLATSAGIARKYLLVGGVVLLLLISFIGIRMTRQKTGTVAGAAATSITAPVNKRFSFAAINNQGQKVTDASIVMNVKDVEKTDQVIVKDQTFIAKNNKEFLIINLELKNDKTQPLNLMPGDLIRLTYGGDTSNKYAPDLHNNLVLVAPISTKLDRVGFVVPKDTKDFVIYIGELEGNKVQLPVHLSS